MGATALPDAHTVAELLGERIEQLCRELLPRGSYAPGRRAWRAGSVAGEAGSALRVILAGPRRARWRDFKNDLGGDALDLVAATACAGDKRRAWRWGLDWLGLRQGIEPAERERLRERTRRAEAARAEAAGGLAERQARDAKALWLAAAPLQPGDLGWRYLAGRGSALELLPAAPAAVRLHRGLWNAESGRAWPALVAAISAPDGRHVNTHRIWLAPRDDGSVGKAPVDKPKLSMAGGYAGGCVRLWRGASGRPWRAMPAGETLLAGEGIEDVLALVCARPEWRACAVLSVSSLGGLALPPQVRRLIWAAQNDPPGSPACRTLTAALARHREAGRAVAIIRPPRWVKDVAEYAEGLAAA